MHTLTGLAHSLGARSLLKSGAPQWFRSSGPERAHGRERSHFVRLFALGSARDRKFARASCSWTGGRAPRATDLISLAFVDVRSALLR